MMMMMMMIKICHYVCVCLREGVCVCEGVGGALCSQ